jgi:hypothetical protein
MKQLTLFCLLFHAYFYAQAQINYLQNEKGKRFKPNILKANLGALALQAASVQYEMLLPQNFSLCIGARHRPNGGLPYKKYFTNRVKDSPELMHMVNMLQFSSTSITPELRYYFSKKNIAEGFYLGVLYKYDTYQLAYKNANITLANGMPLTVNFLGKYTNSGFGFQAGGQIINKHNFVTDWWLVSGIVNKTKTYLGTTSENFNMTQEELNAFQANYSDIRLHGGYFFKNANVIANNQELAVQNTSIGFGARIGLCLGYKF